MHFDKILLCHMCLQAFCSVCFEWYPPLQICICFECVLTYESAPLSLDDLVGLIHRLGFPLQLLSTVVWILFCLVTWFRNRGFFSVYYICIQLFLVTSRAPRSTPLVCSHHISDGGFSLSVVAILSILVLCYPSLFILHLYLISNKASCL